MLRTSVCHNLKRRPTYALDKSTHKRHVQKRVVAVAMRSDAEMQRHLTPSIADCHVATRNTVRNPFIRLHHVPPHVRAVVVAVFLPTSFHPEHEDIKLRALTARSPRTFFSTSHTVALSIAFAKMVILHLHDRHTRKSCDHAGPRRVRSSAVRQVKPRLRYHLYR